MNPETRRGLKFKNGLPCRQFYSKFLKRHPHISLRKGEYFGKNRYAVTEREIREWFKYTEMLEEGVKRFAAGS